MHVVEQGHLGGYVPGGDAATMFPSLWDWIAERAETVLDVGCGDGVALEHLREAGCTVTGIDGVAQEQPWIHQHDFTEGAFPHGDDDVFDVVWCCEFVEHVEEQYVPNFLESLRRGRMVLMTHAEPGQAGFHHVNCQHAGYWISVMKTIGFSVDIDLTMETRLLARRNISPWNHFLRSGLVFVRESD